MNDLLRLLPTSRCVTTRPIPLYDDHGALVRVVKPGTRAVVVSTFDATGSAGLNLRAMVRFDDDPARDAWDVSLSSITEDA